MEKTFEELIEEQQKRDEKYFFYPEEVLELLQQVREATIAEIVNKANEYGEIATADYVSDMPTDRILTDK